MDMGRKPYTEAGKQRRSLKTMEALLPPQLLDIDTDDNRPTGSFNYEVPVPNYDAIAAASAVSPELSTTAAPQNRSSFAHTAPTRCNGGQRATLSQRAITMQQATPQQAGIQPASWHSQTATDRDTDCAFSQFNSLVTSFKTLADISRLSHENTAEDPETRETQRKAHNALLSAATSACNL